MNAIHEALFYHRAGCNFVDTLLDFARLNLLPHSRAIPAPGESGGIDKVVSSE